MSDVTIPEDVRRDAIAALDAYRNATGVILTVKVKRWTEIDGTEMAAAMCNGIELERKPVVEPSLH